MSDDDLNSRVTAKQLMAMELAGYIYQQSQVMQHRSLHAKALLDIDGGVKLSAEELAEVIRMAGNYAATTAVLGVDSYIDPTGRMS